MHRVGFAVATANAREEVKPQAHYLTQAPGGHGAVREAIELILKAQGHWDKILAHYEIGSERKAWLAGGKSVAPRPRATDLIAGSVWRIAVE
jgi:hypothetical protein